MKKVKHTPGPWISEFDAWENAFIVYDKNKKPVAFFHMSMRGVNNLKLNDDYNIEADSHLVAAAPEMLEVLKLFLSREKLGNDQKAIRVLSDVIAKAEGRSE